MKNLGLVLCILFFCIKSYANQIMVDDFHRRFKIHRDQSGNAVMILDRVFHKGLSVAPYIKFLKEAISYQQLNFDSNSIQSKFIDKLNNGDKNNHAPVILDSMAEIKKLDLDKIFSGPKFNELINKYEKDLAAALRPLSFSVLANMEKPTFFYYRKVTYQVTKMALSLAKRWLSSVPALNTASYLLVEVERLVRERRLYHQNMLLHYLDKLKPEELGMTHDEVSMAWSSIYESRIPWYAFWESEKAKNSWSRYGADNFYLNFRMATGRLRDHRRNYVEIGQRINYGFQDAVIEGEGRVVLNLINSRDEWSSQPSIAYYYDQPTKITQIRLLLSVARLGLSFVPIPQFMKDIGENYLKSKYVPQSLTEGSLFAHFEQANEGQRAKDILAQTLNPFEGMFNDSFKQFSY